MKSPDEDGPANPEGRALFLLFVIVAIALGWILLPFYGAIMWGAIIAVLFSPLHRRLMIRLQWGRALAAFSTLVAVLVIGLVDNLLRPVLVGKDTRMPDYVVMITTLGGMAVRGINGFVLGPVIAALFIAVWRIYAMARSNDAPLFWQ